MGITIRSNYMSSHMYNQTKCKKNKATNTRTQYKAITTTWVNKIFTIIANDTQLSWLLCQGIKQKQH